MLADLPLKELARLYFEALLKEYGRDFDLMEPPKELKNKKLLDYIIFVRETGERWGVLIKDWKRPVSSDVILRFKRVIDGLNLTSGIIIGNTISSLASDKAERYNIMAITKGEMISYLYRRGYDKTNSSSK